jgi:sugar lactone lactonase YvrE
MKAKTIIALLAVMLLAGSVFAGGESDKRNHRDIDSFPSFTPFNIGNFEFPEGVAVDEVGKVYVSLVLSPFGPSDYLSDKIWKFSPSGVMSQFVDFGAPGGGAWGLATDARGNVYMARTGLHNGVFRVDRFGHINLLPGTDQIFSPNELAFDQRGNLYVTESNSFDVAGFCGQYGQGGIWRIPKNGRNAELWLRDDLLSGTCPGSLGAFPIGANGIAFYHGDLYVVNSDKDIIVRIPVKANGSPGRPEIWATLLKVPESPYNFNPIIGDGLAIDVHGNIYVVLFGHCAVVRINADDKSQETIAALLLDPQNPLFAPLDFPTSLAFGTGKEGRTSLFITNAGWLGLFYPRYQWPGPGLVKIDVDIDFDNERGDNRRDK